VVKSDNGPPFQGHDFADFASLCGFRHRRITPLWPEANGAVERFMAVINKFVRSMVSEGKNWKNELASFLLHYRATPHNSTKVSPFEAMTGRKMNIGIPEVNRHEITPVSTSAKIINNDLTSKSKMKIYADRKRNVCESTISPGDTVLVKQKRENKLSPPYSPKPYVVTEKYGSMITAESGNNKITRNSSFFKPVKVEVSPIEEDSDVDDVQSQSDQQSDPVAIGPPPATPPNPVIHPFVPRRNPPRQTKMPPKFKDFVLK
jgi:hypothetical protein